MKKPKQRKPWPKEFQPLPHIIDDFDDNVKIIHVAHQHPELKRLIADSIGSYGPKQYRRQMAEEAAEARDKLLKE